MGKGIVFVSAHLGQAWVLPQAQLIAAVSMATEDLPLVAAPLKGADLGARVDGAEWGADKTCGF